MLQGNHGTDHRLPLTERGGQSMSARPTPLPM